MPVSQGPCPALIPETIHQLREAYAQHLCDLAGSEVMPVEEPSTASEADICERGGADVGPRLFNASVIGRFGSSNDVGRGMV